MKVVGMMPVRNEVGRYLADSLGTLVQVCDTVVVLDDASDDGTPDAIAATFPGVELHRLARSLFHEEWRLRAHLLALALAHAPDWVMTLDADEALNRYGVRLIRELLQAYPDVDMVTVPLYDLWDSRTTYRADALWTAHSRFWPLAVAGRVLSPDAFLRREHHCPRFPPGARRALQVSAPKIKHFGWVRREDREAKHARYAALDPDGTWGDPRQYASILDPSPTLEPWKAAHELGLA